MLACTAKHRSLAQAVFAARGGDTSCHALLAAALLQHRDSEVSTWLLSCLFAEDVCLQASTSLHTDLHVQAAVNLYPLCLPADCT